MSDRTEAPSGETATRQLSPTKTIAAGVGVIGKGIQHVGERVDDTIGRSRRTHISRWFWELDRVLLALIVALILVGLLAVTSASPASAERLSTKDGQLEAYYFLYRQLFWLLLGLPLMFFVSMLPPEPARRAAILGFIGCLVIMAMLPIIGTEVNGAKRWINLGFASLQPSEFLKPFFAMTLGWIFALNVKNPGQPFLWFGAALTVLVSMLLMLQPDLGQTIIICAIFGVMLMVSGISMRLVGAVIALGAGGLVAAYFFYGTATKRIDAWLFGSGQHDQIALAHKTLTSGGITGVGPGLGTRKYSLPEAHTDYIFSVVGEEYGLIICAFIACLFFAIVMRVAMRLLDEREPFVIFAATGLITQFGGQAVINMMVNLRLFPSKGMTLPFISYGGSSMIALCITVGLLLALTRRNPWLDRSRYAVKGFAV